MTKNPTEKQLDIIRNKFSFFNNKITLDMQLSKAGAGKDQYTWISLRLKNIETGKDFSICSGDYDWIMTPGKLEAHIWECGRNFEQWDIQESYNLIKK